MVDETEEGSIKQWPILNTFPNHQPTAEEIRFLLWTKYNRILGQPTNNPDEKKNHDELLGAVVDMDHTDEEKELQAELIPQFQFRKLYEEGKVSDNDMARLYETATRSARYSRDNFNPIVGYNGVSTREDFFFRTAIVQAYLTFQSIEQVERLIDLIIEHGNTHPKDQGYWAQIMVDKGTVKDYDPRDYKFQVLPGLRKAKEIYEENHSFDKVEAYFAPQPKS